MMRPNAERFSDQTRVLPCRPAKARQDITGHIVPTFNRDFLDGIGHVRDRDGDGFTDALCGGPDCNDLNVVVYPGSAEVCTDGSDNDCNGVVDDGFVVLPYTTDDPVVARRPSPFGP